jgi:hypothetical protein
MFHITILRDFFLTPRASHLICGNYNHLSFHEGADFLPNLIFKLIEVITFDAEPTEGPDDCPLKFLVYMSNSTENKLILEIDPIMVLSI